MELYLTTYPETAAEKKKNKENLELAEQILAIRKAEVYQSKYNIQNDHKGKIGLLDFYELRKRNGIKPRAIMTIGMQHRSTWRPIVPNHFTLNDIDVDFIKGFKKHPDTVAVTKSHKNLSQNTKQTYFNKFKACLNAAFDEGYLKENFMKKVKGFAMGESTREYLNF